jgi:O-acetyl-ADP-ribose deacetylase (regulator of RNase III)
MRIAVAQGSLTDGGEAVLVNASNTNVTLGTGVSGAIRAACGPGFQDAIERGLEETYGRPMEPGEVLITDAGDHPRARWVAHAAVMDYRKGFTDRSFPTLDTIRTCTTNILDALEDLPEPVTVAWVALGAGTGQLGVRAPTEIACEAILARRSTAKILTGVTFYGYDLIEYAAIANVVSSFFPEVLATIPPEARRLFPGAPSQH